MVADVSNFPGSATWHGSEVLCIELLPLQSRKFLGPSLGHVLLADCKLSSKIVFMVQVRLFEFTIFSLISDMGNLYSDYDYFNSIIRYFHHLYSMFKFRIQNLNFFKTFGGPRTGWKCRLQMACPRTAAVSRRSKQGCQVEGYQVARKPSPRCKSAIWVVCSGNFGTNRTYKMPWI